MNKYTLKATADGILEAQYTKRSAAALLRILSDETFHGSPIDSFGDPQKYINEFTVSTLSGKRLFQGNIIETIAYLTQL